MQKTDRKTVLQGLIEDLKRLKKSGHKAIGIDLMIECLEKSMPSERQQMEDAWISSYVNTRYGDEYTFDDYFSNTFNNGSTTK